MDLSLIVAAVIVAVIILIILFKIVWRVAEPNEALIISGLGARGSADRGAESLGFKIVTGKGASVLPGFQTCRRLSLDSRATTLQVSCVTKQGIPVDVRGVVIYKVGDDFVSIANAARRFLDKQDKMDASIHELFTGHLRSIVGNLTIEDLILNRDHLSGEVRASSADEAGKLGLIVDSLQIQEIDDNTGYITNLGKPHAAAVAAQARIAEAQRDQEATEAEQIAAAKKAASVRESQIQQAGYQAEVDQAAAKSRQAGPLSEATARQEVVVQETRAAELEAELAEKKLQSEVRKPADAKAYETVTLAEADREAAIKRAEADAKQTQLRGEAQASATRATGEAEAAAAKARGLAEADAIKARAEALAHNTEGVVAQQLAENWPEIVRAGSEAFGNIDNLVVLNGAEGIESMLTKALTLGGTGLSLAKTLLNATGNGAGAGANGTKETTGKPDDQPKPEMGTVVLKPKPED